MEFSLWLEQNYGIPSLAAQEKAYRDGYVLHATKLINLDKIKRDGFKTGWFSSTERDAGDQPGEILLALHRKDVPEKDQYGDPSISKSSGYFIDDTSLGDDIIPANKLMIFRGEELVPLLEHFKVIRKKHDYDDSPYIDILFPSGDIWRYIFPNDLIMDSYWKYRFNLGRMVNRIKKDNRILQRKI